MELDLLIRGVIAPVLVAVATLAVFGRDSVRGPGAALTLALLVSCVAQEPIETIPPTAAWQWVPIAALLATAVGLAAGERAVNRAGRCMVCVLSATLACLLLPLPEWSSADARLLLAFGIACLSMLTLPLGMHRGGVSTWFGVAIAFAGSATLVLATGFAKLAVPVGAVGVSCVAVGVTAWRSPHRSLHAGIAGTIAVASMLGMASAAAFAFQTSQLPGWIPALSAAAPLGLWLGEAPPFRGGRVASALARVLGAALPAFVAAAAAVTHAPPTDQGTHAYARRVDAATHLPTHAQLVGR